MTLSLCDLGTEKEYRNNTQFDPVPFVLDRSLPCYDVSRMAEITFHNDLRGNEPRRSFLNVKRWLLFVYVPIFVSVCSILGIVFEEHKGFSLLVDIALALGLNIFELMWCRMDSRERGYELHRHFTFAVVIFGVLALLYYLFRSRDFREGLISIGWLVLYVIALLVVSSVVSGLVVMVFVVTGAVSPSILE